MTRRTATRSALVTLCLLTLAACVVNLSFAIDKPGVVLKSDPGVTTLQQNIPVNLADYKEVTDHRSNIKSFDLDYVDVTITAKDLSSTANTVSGTVSLRRTLTDPPGSDIPVGTLNAVPLVVGQTQRISGTPALDAFLLQQLQTAGSFYVIINGSLDHGSANVTADFNLHVALGYDAGLF